MRDNDLEWAAVVVWEEDLPAGLVDPFPEEACLEVMMTGGMVTS